MKDSLLYNWDIFLTLLIAVIMAVLTLTPLPEALPTPGSDKLHHIIAFAVLCLPLSATRPKSAIYVFVGAVGYGGAIEIIQPMVNRSGEWMDFWADCLGAAFGILIGKLYLRLNPQRTKQ